MTCHLFTWFETTGFDVEVEALQQRSRLSGDDIRAMGAGAGLVRPRTGCGVVLAKACLVARLSLPIGSDILAMRGGGVMTSATVFDQ